MMPAMLLTMGAALVQPPIAELYMVKSGEETWTRNTKTGAMGLADNLAAHGRACSVCYAETGEVFYEPSLEKEHPE